jgi:transcriptional regulator with XRE-family HTH domain
VKLRTHRDVLAKNLSRVRKQQGLTQDEVAARARDLGLQWSQQSVSDLEAGRLVLSVGEWWLAPAIYRVPAAELVRCDGEVDVEGAVLSDLPRDLPKLAEGRQLVHKDLDLRWNVEAPTSAEQRVLERYGVDISALGEIHAEARSDATRKAARALSSRLRRQVEPFEIAVASYALWDRGLSAQRDALLEDENAAPRTRQALRGHVTRRLTDELKERIERTRRRAR